MSCARLVAFARSRWFNRLFAVAGDSAGSLLPMVAIGLLVMMALIGGGVDMSRVYKVQNRLQSACDAAVLAGRKAVTTNGFNTAAQTQANSFFNVNFDLAQQGVTMSVPFRATYSDTASTVVGTATAVVPMLVMEVFGMGSIPVTANCTATEGIGNVDVTFVLDTTGSMDTILTGTSTRLDSLKSAAKNFFTTLNTSTTGTTARVRYSFVPFSAGVNVGSLLYNLNPAYLIDTYTVQSRVARMKTTVSSRFQNNATNSYPTTQEAYPSSGYNTTPAIYGSSYASLPACQAATPADTAWANNGSSSSSSTNNFTVNSTSVTRVTVTQPQTRTYYFCNRSVEVYYIYSYTASHNYLTITYGALVPTATSSSTAFDHWDYRPVSYDVSQYKTGATVTTATGSNGANQSSTWGGCIEERYTRSDATFTYDSTAGRITPTTAIDLDIDTAPTSDNATKWAPLWPEVGYFRTSSGSSTGSITSSLLTQSGGLATAYCPTAATTLATMSQTAFNSYVDGLVANGDTYHDFGMLWGARLSSPNGIFSSIVNLAPTNRQSVSRHLILETDGQPNAAYYIQQMYGIEYHDRRITDDGYTNDDTRHIARFRAICDAVKANGIRIWVVATATALTSDLTYCASPNSSYTAANSGDLDSAFQSIAKQIGELRISR